MFKGWPKIPRLENEVFCLTEKIDGTNACIIIQENSAGKLDAWAQSRTRIITPENDNYGFAKWVEDNKELLISDLGVGYHFGEWWGKGINRGYGMEDRRFSLFNPKKESICCLNVPVLAKNVSSNLLSSVIEYEKQYLVHSGSRASPGYMKPEGIIIYAEKSKNYWKVIIDK